MIFNRKAKPKIEKSIGAMLYAERIILETRNKKDEFMWYSTDSISVLPTDISDEKLGDAVMAQLDQSVHSDIPHEKIKELRASFRKKAKFRSEKELMKDGKLVSIHLDDMQIQFNPYKIKLDGQQYIGLRLPKCVSTINTPIDNVTIGGKLRKAWSMCE